MPDNLRAGDIRLLNKSQLVERVEELLTAKTGYVAEITRLREEAAASLIKAAQRENWSDTLQRPMVCALARIANLETDACDREAEITRLTALVAAMRASLAAFPARLAAEGAQITLTASGEAVEGLAVTMEWVEVQRLLAHQFDDGHVFVASDAGMAEIDGMLAGEVGA